MEPMRSEDLRRASNVRRPNLEATLFARAAGQDGTYDAVVEELREVREKLRRAERKLEAIETLAGIDAGAIRAATMHTRLVCQPSRYAFAEVDEPPPRVGEAVSTDGELYVVDRLVPSPLPGDVRRCAVLVRVA